MKFANQIETVKSDASEQISKARESSEDALSAGANKIVGWTVENTKTATSSRGLRPMHVRVSLRVHHVAFLHPGLDNGGGATIGGTKNWKWLSEKGKKGAKKAAELRNSIIGGKKGDSPLNNLRKDLEKDSDAKDAAEISEIISSEAFRLSRDGIIQHHFALNYASQQQKPANNQRASSPSRFSTPPRSTRLGGKPNQQTSPKSNPHSSMLSSYSAANPEEAARYYKECAERPKGYRRLVVSSAVPTNDVPPPPPVQTKTTNFTSSSYLGSSSKQLGSVSRNLRDTDPPYQRKDSCFSEAEVAEVEEITSPRNKDKGKNGNGKDDGRKENLFDNVEYHYVSILIFAVCIIFLCALYLTFDAFFFQTNAFCRLAHPKQAPSFSSYYALTEVPHLVAIFLNWRAMYLIIPLGLSYARHPNQRDILHPRSRWLLRPRTSYGATLVTRC